jgi:hypothetical protein
VATGAVVAAANAHRGADGGAAGQGAEVAADVAGHREAPAAGLMQRGL